MLDAIHYCPHFAHSPRACGGVSSQTIYDAHGNAIGRYSCTACYAEIVPAKNVQELMMSEHSVLLATQRKVDKLEAANSILQGERDALAKDNIKLHKLLEDARNTADKWRRAYVGDHNAEELWLNDMWSQIRQEEV